MTKNTNRPIKYARLISLLLLAVSLVLMSSGWASALTNQQIEDQKEDLEERIAANQAELERYAHEADTLANKVAALDAQIRQLQDQISLTEASLAATRQQLEETRRQLEEQKAILRKSLREHYTFGDVRTIELLAESDSFSDFFDQQEYLNRIRSSIQESAQKVAELEEQLEAQEKQQSDLLTQLNGQKAQLDSTRQEQAELLAYTRGQEALYQKRVNEDRNAVARLQAILAARTRRVISGGTGGYPYPNSCGNPYPDPWTAGYCPAHWSYIDRQCTSWAYWRRQELGLGAGMFWSHARYWKSRAQADGYRVNQTPEVGAIGVKYNGGSPANHVYVVESVVDSNTVIASQYNAQNSATDYQWGRYSLVEYDSTDDWFIHEHL